MKINIYIAIIVFITITSLLSCHVNQKECSFDGLIKIYTIDVEKSDKVNMSTLFDSITYIPLETTAEATISSIDKIEFEDSLFFILDKRANTVWFYNSFGKYLHNIHKVGQGPGEYISICDFQYDRWNKSLFVLDRENRKIISYDIYGNIKNTINLIVTAEQFSLLGDNKILLYTRGRDIYMSKDKDEYGYNFFLVDHYGTILDKFFEYNEFVDNLMGRTVFASNGNESWVHYGNNDTIYSFKNNGSLIAKYLFDFGTHRIPIETINNSYDMKNYGNMSSYSSIMGVHFSDEYSLITYIYKNRVHFLIKNNDSDNIINVRFLENDIDPVSYANPSPILLKKNRLFFIKDYESISRNDGFIDLETFNNTILNSIEKDDNPFISIAHLKTNL
jgi:hypothetical protein